MKEVQETDYSPFWETLEPDCRIAFMSLQHIEQFVCWDCFYSCLLLECLFLRPELCIEFERQGKILNILQVRCDIPPPLKRVGFQLHPCAVAKFPSATQLICEAFSSWFIGNCLPCGRSCIVSRGLTSRMPFGSSFEYTYIDVHVYIPLLHLFCGSLSSHP